MTASGDQLCLSASTGRSGHLDMNIGLPYLRRGGGGGGLSTMNAHVTELKVFPL